MRERADILLRVTCLILTALLLFQVVRRAVRRDPLANLRIPALPTLAVAGDKSTNAAGAGAPQKAGTNSGSVVGAAKPTNSSTDKALAGATTNAPATTNATGSTNVAALTNQVPKSPLTAISNTAPNIAKGDTNSPSERDPKRTGTNLVTPAEPAKSSTNAPRSPGSLAQGPTRSRPGPAMDMGASPRPGMGPPIELPPAVRVRVDRITESEILGPVMRPLPMALLGIAGETAFLRAPNGQTGLVKEGSDVGGLKLLRIGTNRVLVEQDGEKKELIIFNGLGGESLLPK